MKIKIDNRVYRKRAMKQVGREIEQVDCSDVRYIDFISIFRYFCSYSIVLKSILHLLMLDKYRSAEIINNTSNYQA